jgi:hypothetical protein
MGLTVGDVDSKIVADKFLYGNGMQSLLLTRGSDNGTKGDVPVVTMLIKRGFDQSCQSKNCT